MVKGSGEVGESSRQAQVSVCILFPKIREAFACLKVGGKDPGDRKSEEGGDSYRSRMILTRTQVIRCDEREF